MLPVGPVLPVALIPVFKLLFIIILKISPVELLPVVAFPVSRIEFIKPVTLVFLIPVLPALRHTIMNSVKCSLLIIGPLHPGSIIPRPGIEVFEISPVKVVPVVSFPVLRVKESFPGKLVRVVPIFETPWFIFADFFLFASLVNLLLLVFGPFLPLVIIPLAVVLLTKRRPFEFLPIVFFPVSWVKVLEEEILVFGAPHVEIVGNLRLIFIFFINDPLIIFNHFPIFFVDPFFVINVFSCGVVHVLINNSLLANSPSFPVAELPLIKVIVLEVGPVKFLPVSADPILGIEP